MTSSTPFGLHSGYKNETLRLWQSSGSELHPHNLMLPLFITDESPDAKQDIPSLPGVSRWGVNSVLEFLKPNVANGLSSVLLFGVPEKVEKDANGKAGETGDNPVMEAVKRIKAQFPNLTVACDVCLCPYTSHGHCGVLNEDAEGSINNEASLPCLASQALAFATAGCDIVAPSDMMDGRVLAIKKKLAEHGFANKVAVLSYAVKFSSSFYGPFRDAAKSAPTFGDRKRYQLPCGSRGLAARAAARDVSEGADMLMVKPGLAYLDLVRETKNSFPHHPMFIYQVSGEYAMIHHGAANGAFNLETTLMEVLTSMRRAGADVIISYFTPRVLEMIK
eukprot:GFUD01033372.1.p1 GENE.GFUD01033372.1~~GFUD01033372.1.p1  ORF type:complete len:334 (+),score=99.11 GFUD01033372.1:38-1039(+)